MAGPLRRDGHQLRERRAGTFAARIDGGALETGSGSSVIAQGDYNLTLSATTLGGGTTNGSTLLLAGTVDVYRCVIAAGSAACTLRNTTNALNGCAAPAMVAPAQHALAFGPSSRRTPGVPRQRRWPVALARWNCPNRHGLLRRRRFAHFDNLNGPLGSLAEVTGFAQPSDGCRHIARGPRRQRHGRHYECRSRAARAEAHGRRLSAGEGGLPLIDATMPSQLVCVHRRWALT